MKNKKTKITAIIAALALLFSAGATSCTKDDSKKENTETTVSTSVDEELGLILTEDFDINDKEAVKARAQAIYDISEQKISVDKIMNIIYYFNDKLDSLNLGKTDEEKVSTLKAISSDAYLLLNDNIEDDSFALIDILNGKEKAPSEDEEIFAYMLLASGDEKNLALENARIVKEQLNNIQNKNTKNFSPTAEKFYTNVMDIKNNKDIKDSAQTIILICTKSKLMIMSGSLLSEEKTDALNKINYVTSLNLMYSNAIKKLGINQDDIIDEKRDEGTLGQTLTPFTEKYIKEEAKEAATHPAITEEKETTTVIAEGGNKVSGSDGKQEVVTKKEESTTTVDEEEFVAPVPEDVTKEEVITGGEVVSEEEMYITVPNEYGDIVIGRVYADDSVNIYNNSAFVIKK